MDENDKDFGLELSEKSIKAFEAGDYLEAFNFQVEAFESSITVMIAGRARRLGMSNTKVKKLAYKGTLEKKIDNLTELCGDDFSHLCNNLHEYRDRRNRLIHRKSSFKGEEEMNDFARETWFLGTTIIYYFVESISGIPNLK
jgi:hypothetical protein